MDRARGFEVNADPAAFGIDVTRHTAGELKAQEEDLINRILALIPQKDSAAVAQALRDPAAFATDVDESPELARLVSHLYAIRAADHAATRRARVQAGVRRRGTDVVFVFGEQGLGSDESAAIIRRSDKRPQNVVIIRPEHASAAMVGYLISRLTASRFEHGDAFRSDIREGFRQNEPPRADSTMGTMTEGVFAKLRQEARDLEIEGLGLVRAARLHLNPPHP